MQDGVKHLLALLLLAFCAVVQAQERLQVADPYIELRTGPGRGYPVFFVAERHQAIEIELRHTDWYRVKADGGQVGWVHRSQLEATLTADGVPKSFRDILVDDYLKRRAQAGIAWGRFKSEPMLKLWGGYRLSDTLGLEATLGQVQGTYSGSDFWHVDATVEPWSDRRLSPYFAVGLGQLRNFPNQSLVDAKDTNSPIATAGIGLRWYLSDRFVVRGDATLYTGFHSDNATDDYGAFTVGISFFF